MKPASPNVRGVQKKPKETHQKIQHDPPTLTIEIRNEERAPDQDELPFQQPTTLRAATLVEPGEPRELCRQKEVAFLRVALPPLLLT